MLKERKNGLKEPQEPTVRGTRAAIFSITMILISIQPFAPKKLFALGATIACLSTASCFADAMYLSSKSHSPQRDVQPRAQVSANAVADSAAALAIGPAGARLA